MSNKSFQAKVGSLGYAFLSWACNSRQKNISEMNNTRNEYKCSSMHRLPGIFNMVETAKNDILIALRLYVETC